MLKPIFKKDAQKPSNVELIVDGVVDMVGLDKTMYIRFIGIPIFFLVIVLLSFSIMGLAENVEYSFQANLTNKPSLLGLLDIEAGPNNTVLLMGHAFNIYAYQLSNGNLVMKWSTPQSNLRVYLGGMIKTMNIVKTNITGAEKYIVVSYFESTIPYTSNEVYSVYFWDLNTGQNITKPITDLPGHLGYDFLKTPKIQYGDHIWIALTTSGDSVIHVIKYYPNGTYLLYDLGLNWLANSPCRFDFSPRGTRFAAVNLQSENITIFDLTQPGWNETGKSYNLTSVIKYIKWLDENKLFVISGETLNLNGNEYVKSFIIDAETDSIKEVYLGNVANMDFSKINDDYMDENGNLILVLQEKVNITILLDKQPMKYVFVFNENNIQWQDENHGIYVFAPEPLTDEIQENYDIGPGYIFYILSYRIDTLQEYSIVQQGGNIAVQFGAKHMFFDSISNNEAIKAINNSKLAITIPTFESALRFSSRYSGGLHVSLLDIDTGNLQEIDYIPIETELHEYDSTIFNYICVHKALMIDAMDISPSGTMLALGGGLEDISFFDTDITPYNEKAMILVYDVSTGQRIFEYNVTFQGSETYFNIFVPAVKFIDNSRLLAAIQYYDYTGRYSSSGQPTIVNRVLVFDLDSNSGNPLFDYQFNTTFIPGDLRTKALFAIPDGDTIYVLYSYQGISENGNVTNLLALKTIRTLEDVITDTLLMNITGDDHTGIYITGAELSKDKEYLYATIIDMKEIVGDGTDNIPYSYLLKINLTSNTIASTLNLTDMLFDVNDLRYYNETNVAGTATGLRYVNNTLFIHTELYWGNPQVNEILADENLNLIGNISLAIEENYEGPWTTNYGLSYDPTSITGYHAPTNHHFDVIGGGNTVYLMSGLGIHELSLNATAPSTPPAGGGVGGGETGGEGAGGGQGEGVNMSYIPLTEDQRKAIDEASEKVNEIDEFLGSHNTTSISDLKMLFDELHINDTMENLNRQGIIRDIVWFTPQQRENLRELLESIYGPFLENYPTAIGRLYLLFVLYYME